MILAKIPYLNTAPYFHFLSKRWLGQHQLVSRNPRQLGELARQGGLDAGLFSLTDAWKLVEEGGFEMLGDLGIAGRGPIKSILLFGQDPPSLEGRRVAVTGHTATSSRLMQVWLREKVGLKSWEEVAPGDPEAAATLLIGDEALARAARTGEAATDLCAEWTAWTGLPFVFARWAVRASLPERDKMELRASLSSAVELALDDLEAVAGALAQDTAFQAAEIRAYLEGITYKIGPGEEEGAALFRGKLAAYNRNL